MNKAGIVVITWNHINFSKQCFEALIRYTPDTPIVVIDNGSTDETIEYLQDLKNNLYIDDFIINEKNLGIAPALNQGIKWCVNKGLDFCFVSNDCIVGKDWLKNLQEGLYKYECIGGGSPYIAPEATYDNVVNMEFRNKYRNYYWPRLKNDPSVDELWNILDEIHGGNFDLFTEAWSETRKNTPPLYEWFSMVMYLKKSTIEKVGLFDEQFVPSNWEDMDYMVRMNNYSLFRIGVTGSYVFHWSNISNRNEFRDRPESYSQEMTENEKRFHRKWKVFLPYNERQNGPDGDKYTPGKIGDFCPFEVSDLVHNRKHDKWLLWEPEKYPNYIQKWD